MGVGDEIPAGARAARRARSSCSAEDQLAWGDLGRLRRGDDRRARLRAPRRSARLQPAPARLRAGRRHGDRQLQQVRVQPGAVRARTPARSAAERVTDENSKVQRARSRSIRCSPRPTGSPTPTGQGWRQERGLYFFDTRPTRSTPTWSSSWSRSRTTRARSAARWSRPRSARAAGSTSASACGGSCRPAPTAPIG